MLVDTSVWIDYLNGYASPQADFLATAIAENAPIVLCGVVLTEILLGLPNLEARRIEDLLDAFSLAPEFERDDYGTAAHIYRTCRDNGITIRSVIDCLIAQTCLKHNYPLLAKDRDFVQIARYFPLQLCS
jgi:predicted nucleic acid-binding protein